MDREHEEVKGRGSEGYGEHARAEALLDLVDEGLHKGHEDRGDLQDRVGRGEGRGLRGKDRDQEKKRVAERKRERG